jgi:hypothetical protein
MLPEITLPDGTRLACSNAADVIRAYCTENSTAIDLYDRTNDGPHDELLPIDVLALGALNAFGGASPMTVMSELWKVRSGITETIRRITMQDFTQISDSALAEERFRVCEALEWFWKSSIPQWGGGTRPAKLLHRLRPNIIPIWDEWIGTWYGGPKQSWQEFVAAVHSDVRNPSTLECLRRIKSELTVDLPILRLWDILLWKTKSTAS